ncbi:hypothetical protein GOP47_0019823 [Adiantum capillus-veneris]|uniref:Uncharacterized protein n=1 Tax=Adiantum capillus-veneris TaxID=13818 RepID=A0A9D4UBS6_ADICA|nr:hypothetical protein GOP47_0019823 [Adiantum capillus-veneris]
MPTSSGESASGTKETNIRRREKPLGPTKKIAFSDQLPEQSHFVKMILLSIFAQLLEDYMSLLARVVTQIVQEAPFPRRVRQLILRRLNPISAPRREVRSGMYINEDTGKDAPLLDRDVSQLHLG